MQIQLSGPGADFVLKDYLAVYRQAQKVTVEKLEGLEGVKCQIDGILVHDENQDQRGLSRAKPDKNTSL